MIRAKSGYLQKLKGGWKSRGGRREATRYFFKLNSTYFQQLDNELDSSPKKSPLVTDIKDVSVRDIEQLCFDVQLRKEGTWTLMASTQQDMFDWMETLQPGSTAGIRVSCKETTQCIPSQAKPDSGQHEADRRGSNGQPLCRPDSPKRYISTQTSARTQTNGTTCVQSRAPLTYDYATYPQPLQSFQLSQSLPSFSGSTTDGTPTTAANKRTPHPQCGYQRQISIDDEGYIPMSLQSPTTDQQFSSLDNGYYKEPSQIMSCYARPPVHNFLGLSLSLDGYLRPVPVTPPRARHGSLASPVSELYKVPRKPLVAEEDAVDIPQDQDPRHFLKRLPVIDRDRLVIQQEIAKGNFGVVYKGVYKIGNTPVAAKALKFNYSERDFGDFIKEAYIVSQLHHPNIVDFYGVVQAVSPPYLVLELMENGALDLFLQRVRNQRPLRVLIHYIGDIVAGMVYLSRRKFIHRDLAARNILISREEHCKISDFGLTRKMDSQSMYVSQGGRVATKWASPEALTDQQFTNASDVWSFGIVMWEVMTFGDTPYGDWTGEKTVVEITTNRYRLRKPKICPPLIYEVMWKCWEHKPLARPSFSQISEWIESRSRSL